MIGQRRLGLPLRHQIGPPQRHEGHAVTAHRGGKLCHLAPMHRNPFTVHQFARTPSPRFGIKIHKNCTQSPLLRANVNTISLLDQLRRIQRFKANIARSEEDIAGLKREMARLPAGK